VVRNAVAFTHDEGEIAIRLYQEDERIVIAVIDTGRGIPAKDQETIWDVMTQSERGKYEHQGVGMGLPIVKQTMLLHKGDAALHSVLGEGTTVCLSFPKH
jgi:signal transduction histidine kinase